MPIIPEERNCCCLSFRSHECFSCWPQHCQGRRILGKPCLIQRAPLLCKDRPQTSPECVLRSPHAAGHTLRTRSSCGFFQGPTVPPSARSLCRCESRAVGDKGNTAPILWSPIQEAGRERLPTAGLSASEALTRVAWLGAGHGSSRRDPHNGCTSCRHPARTHVSCQAQPVHKKKLPSFPGFLFSPLSLSHSRLPEQKPRGSSGWGQERHHFL